MVGFLLVCLGVGVFLRGIGLGFFVCLFAFLNRARLLEILLSHQDSTFCYLQATGPIELRMHDIIGTEIPRDYRMPQRVSKGVTRPGNRNKVIEAYETRKTIPEKYITP